MMDQNNLYLSNQLDQKIIDSKPIIKLYLTRPSEAWYSLDPLRAELIDKQVQNSLRDVGGKKILACSVFWATEAWTGFGIERYPSLDAVWGRDDVLDMIPWDRYINSWSVLGTIEQDLTVNVNELPGSAIYKLTLEKFSSARAMEQTDASDRRADGIEPALASLLDSTLIACDVSWATDEWTRYRVDTFSSISAIQAQQTHQLVASTIHCDKAWSVLGTRGRTRPQRS